jgi:hypothetical protein
VILSPMALAAVPEALAALRSHLHDALALAVLDRIAATLALVPRGVDTPQFRTAAVELARRCAIPVLDEEPQQALSWDGRVLRTRSESYVLMHEVAHWLLCPAARRALPDFGLGAGPESGRPDLADAAISVGPDERQEEECLSSLLGILWEAALAQPAILAFLEQNWLEGWERPACAENLARHVALLHQRGRIDGTGRPIGPDVSDLAA